MPEFHCKPLHRRKVYEKPPQRRSNEILRACAIVAFAPPMT